MVKNWLNKYKEPFLDNWYSINGGIYFALLCVLYFVIFILKRMLVIDGIAAFEVLEDRGEMWVFDLIMGLEYATVPVFLLWRITCVTFLTWIGCFLFGYKLTFGQLWKLILILELWWLLPELAKLGWFVFFAYDPDYHEVVNFYPLSLSNLISLSEMDSRWIYPLKTLNLFEIGYWLWLGAGIFWLSGKKASISFVVALVAYVLPLLLWLTFYVMAYR